MNPTTVSLVVFACVFGGTLGGMWLRSILPQHHLDAESKDTVKVGIGLIATMTALVLGLVTASAKSSFDSTNATVKQAAITILALDRALARFGPEASGIRKDLQQALEVRIEQIWGRGLSTRVDLDATNIRPGLSAERLAEVIRGLTPHDDSQRSAQVRALELIEALLQARWLIAGGGDTSVPVPFLSVLVFWLTLTFASFGVFAPRNATVLAVLIVCALSVSSALFLVLEMDGPFDGLIKASADPLRYALTHINH
ncbi:MAG: DUF4239 domain-containing protein [Nitrospira sp.]|nr:DUF4239 domain-containing protein [Nitrospira sp.]